MKRRGFLSFAGKAAVVGPIAPNVLGKEEPESLADPSGDDKTIFIDRIERRGHLVATAIPWWPEMDELRPEDTVYDISPIETPADKMTNRDAPIEHEWITDELKPWEAEKPSQKQSTRRS